MTAEQKNWLDALKAFESAALKLEHAWNDLEMAGGESPTGYPFESSFDEVCDDIHVYREGAEKEFGAAPKKVGGAR